MLVVRCLSVDESSDRLGGRVVPILRVHDDESAREFCRLVLVVVRRDGAVEDERVREEQSFQLGGRDLKSANLGGEKSKISDCDNLKNQRTSSPSAGNLAQGSAGSQDYDCEEMNV